MASSGDLIAERPKDGRVHFLGWLAKKVGACQVTFKAAGSRNRARKICLALAEEVQSGSIQTKAKLDEEKKRHLSDKSLFPDSEGSDDEKPLTALCVGKQTAAPTEPKEPKVSPAEGAPLAASSSKVPEKARPIVIIDDDELPPATKDEGLAAFLPPSDHEAWTKVRFAGRQADPYYGFKHSGVSAQVTCHQTKLDRGRAKRLAVAMCYQLMQGKTKKDILSFRAEFLKKWADKLGYTFHARPVLPDDDRPGEAQEDLVRDVVVDYESDEELPAVVLSQFRGRRGLPPDSPICHAEKYCWVAYGSEDAAAADVPCLVRSAAAAKSLPLDWTGSRECDLGCGQPGTSQLYRLRAFPRCRQPGQSRRLHMGIFYVGRTCCQALLGERKYTPKETARQQLAAKLQSLTPEQLRVWVSLLDRSRVQLLHDILAQFRSARPQSHERKRLLESLKQRLSEKDLRLHLAPSIWVAETMFAERAQRLLNQGGDYSLLQRFAERLRTRVELFGASEEDDKVYEPSGDSPPQDGEACLQHPVVYLFRGDGLCGFCRNVFETFEYESLRPCFPELFEECHFTDEAAEDSGQSSAEEAPEAAPLPLDEKQAWRSRVEALRQNLADRLASPKTPAGAPKALAQKGMQKASPADQTAIQELEDLVNSLAQHRPKDPPVPKPVPDKTRSSSSSTSRPPPPREPQTWVEKAKDFERKLRSDRASEVWEDFVTWSQDFGREELTRMRQVCKVLDVVQGVQGPLRKLAAKLMVRWKQNLHKCPQCGEIYDKAAEHVRRCTAGMCDGCDRLFKIDELDAHQAKCQHFTVCPGCGVRMLKRNWREHQEECAGYRRCLGCHKAVLKRDLQNHYKECQQVCILDDPEGKPVPMDQALKCHCCNKRVFFKDLQTHQKERCPETVFCRDCNMPYKKGADAEHRSGCRKRHRCICGVFILNSEKKEHQKKCPEYEKCHTCGEFILRSQTFSHASRCSQTRYCNNCCKAVLVRDWQAHQVACKKRKDMAETPKKSSKRTASPSNTPPSSKKQRKEEKRQKKEEKRLKKAEKAGREVAAKPSPKPAPRPSQPSQPSQPSSLPPRPAPQPALRPLPPLVAAVRINGRPPPPRMQPPRFRPQSRRRHEDEEAQEELGSETVYLEPTHQSLMGWFVGRGGANIKAFEKEYGVNVQRGANDLYIEGPGGKARRAASAVREFLEANEMVGEEVQIEAVDEDFPRGLLRVLQDDKELSHPRITATRWNPADGEPPAVRFDCQGSTLLVSGRRRAAQASAELIRREVQVEVLPTPEKSLRSTLLAMRRGVRVVHHVEQTFRVCIVIHDVCVKIVGREVARAKEYISWYQPQPRRGPRGEPWAQAPEAPLPPPPSQPAAPNQTWAQAAPPPPPPSWPAPPPPPPPQLGPFPGAIPQLGPFPGGTPHPMETLLALPPAPQAERFNAFGRRPRSRSRSPVRPEPVELHSAEEVAQKKRLPIPLNMRKPEAVNLKPREDRICVDELDSLCSVGLATPPDRTGSSSFASLAMLAVATAKELDADTTKGCSPELPQQASDSLALVICVPARKPQRL
eukprot:s1295_g13.t2